MGHGRRLPVQDLPAPLFHDLALHALRFVDVPAERTAIQRREEGSVQRPRGARGLQRKSALLQRAGGHNRRDEHDL